MAELECVGFDSGKSASIPKDISDHEDHALLIAWMRGRGMDAIWYDDAGLLGVGLKAKRLDDATWDNFTPAQLKLALVDVPTVIDQLVRSGKDAPTTYAFQTHNGSQGILQVSGVIDQQGAVMLRYKLVQAPANTTSEPSAAGPATAYGPVIERTVEEAVGFDAGRTAIVPASLWRDFRALDWMKQEGMDALWDGDVKDDADAGFWGVDLKTSLLDSVAWDNLTPEQLRQTLALRPSQAHQQLSRPSETPTWSFQTRTGRLGLLQILGFTENSRAVKIRYKLVPASTAIKVVEPPPAASATSVPVPRHLPEVGGPPSAP